MDINGVYHPIPQTMAGVEIDIDSDEYQSWYVGFTKFPPPAIFEAVGFFQSILKNLLGANVKPRIIIMLPRGTGTLR